MDKKEKGPATRPVIAATPAPTVMGPPTTTSALELASRRQHGGTNARIEARLDALEQRVKRLEDKGETSKRAAK